MHSSMTRTRSLWAALLAMVFAMVAAFTLSAAPSAYAADDDASADKTWNRLEGKIALDTMNAIVNEGWTTSDVVVLTTQDGYWDALTAAGIAGQVNAPVLMTDTNSLSDQTKTALAKLKPTKIIVVGGTAAVAADVADAAKAATGVTTEVVRAAGTNAIGTANDVADKMAEYTGGTWADTAFVATNDGYWDALAAAPIAYAKNMPIFLADGHASLTDDTIKAMQDAGIKNVYLVGGTAALTEDVEKQLKDNEFTVADRLGGKTAVETSEAVATEGVNKLGMSLRSTGVATMDGYWDALTGAALCGLKGSPIVLVADATSDSITNFLAKHADGIFEGYIFGGTAAVSADAAAAIEKAAPGGESVKITFAVDKTNFDYTFDDEYKVDSIDIATPEAQTIEKYGTLDTLPEPSASVQTGKTSKDAAEYTDFFPEWYTTEDCSGNAVTITTTFDKDTTLYAKIVPSYVTVNLQTAADQSESGEYAQTIHLTEAQFKALKSDGGTISGVYNTTQVTTATEYVTLEDLFSAADEKLGGDASDFSAAWADDEGGVYIAASDGFSNSYSIADMKAGKFFPKYDGKAGGDAAGSVAVAPALSLVEAASAINATNATAAAVQTANEATQTASGYKDKNSPRMIVGMTDDQFAAASTLAGNKFVSNVTTITLQTPEAGNYVTITFNVNAPDGKTVSTLASQTIAKGGKVATKVGKVDYTSLTCDGYTFLGWFTHASDPDGKTETAYDLSTATFSSSQTLYARWAEVGADASTASLQAVTL